MRYPAQVADQSENLFPRLLRYIGFFNFDQFTTFWELLYLQMIKTNQFYALNKSS